VLFFFVVIQSARLEKCAPLYNCNALSLSLSLRPLCLLLGPFPLEWTETARENRWASSCTKVHKEAPRVKLGQACEHQLGASAHSKCSAEMLVVVVEFYWWKISLTKREPI